MVNFLIGVLWGAWVTMMIASYLYEKEKEKEKKTNDKTKH